MINRGSEWRKWDLHLHSKYSRESRTKMEISDIFINAIKNNISMISITDHSNFDALDEVWDVYENGTFSEGKFKDFIEFLPGIEVKTDKGKKGVHLISIFPKRINIKGNLKKADKKTLYDNFCSQLKLTESVIESNGDGNYLKGLLASTVDFDKVVTLTHELGGLVIIHGGDKHGSIEKEMKDAKRKEPTAEELYEYLDMTKTDIIVNKIDVIELPNFNRREAQNAKFYKQCFGKPCMLASDSHEKAEYNFIEKYTWIKADCTFEGLKQALIDYDNRICLKEIPDELERVKKNPTKYIDRIILDWENGYRGEKGKWFKNIEVPLNSGLISIIGNKGNGKSALAEAMAWTADSRNYSKFAFLNGKKFQKNKLASNFLCKMKWKNSEEVCKNLAIQPEMTNIERIQCIPQQYFEEICTDTELQKFTEEINSVIFSRLSEEEKEGEVSLENLIDKYSRVSESSIQHLSANLNEINKQIIELENKKLPTYAASQESLLKDAKSQLDAHDKICPSKVEKPVLSENVRERYEQLESIIKELSDQIEEKEKRIVEISKDSNALSRDLEMIDDFENRMGGEIEKIRLNLEEFDIHIDDIINLKIDRRPIKEKKKKIDDELLDIRELLNDKNIGLKVRISKMQSDKQRIIADEDKNIRAYDQYMTEYQEWSKVRDEKAEAVKKVQEELSYIKNKIEDDLAPLYKERIRVASDICNEKKKIISVYNRFKEPVDNFLSENKELLNDYSINIRSGLVVEESFQNEVFDFINKQKKNAFRDDNYQLYKTIEKLNNIEVIDEHIKIPELIIDCLNCFETDIMSQIKTNKLLEFYNYLYGMSYITNKYELISDEKTLDNLSPGERGSLLLIFYLLLDLRDIPLIIDQPEDNLDNQSVAKVLVPFIKAAKKRRQIILVTHNPNLAVVADSDQIIYVKIDKENNQEVNICAGGIENPEINNSVVTILEGTMYSFRKRDEKYIVRK
ncbi:MAG: PHP domain-containing protein [Dorea sp.]|nr:PHP domain-containing protein [Dorea sp.]